MTRPAFSIFSHSVGANVAGHALPAKLRAIAAAGFDAVEIFSDDLSVFANSAEFASHLDAAAPSPPDSPLARAKLLAGAAASASASSSSTLEPALVYNAYGPCSAAELAREQAAAAHIGSLCASLGLSVLNLQPLRDIEGWVSDADFAAARARVNSRFPIMRALGTSLLLACSNNEGAPRTSGDAEFTARQLATYADDARRFAEECGGEVIRIGYEALAWGAHVDTWTQAYERVRLADRENLGLVLDSFNTLAREYADPCVAGCVASPNALENGALAASLDAISKLPAERIFLLQLGDARPPPAPLAPASEADPRPARLRWSRSHRLFPGEKSRGAFMPLPDFVRAVRKAGFTGAWSIEVFADELSNEDAGVPEEMSRRAFQGLEWLLQETN
jgi:sugar phosphate isomerase/epimerase